jgi:hypothetical protein
MPGERKAARKKDAGPRAVAVLRLSANGKSSLVPIAILINGKFWDAAAYKADPVPMALEPETVYEVEQTGSSLGLFTVQSALHANGVNVPIPWIATGLWHPAGEEPAHKAAKAETVPAGLGASDAPPRLTRNATATSSSEKDSGAKTASPPAQSKPAEGSGSDSSSNDGPPRLIRPDATPSSPPSSSPSSPSSSGTSTSASAGGSGQTDKTTAPASSQSPPSGSSSTPPASSDKAQSKAAKTSSVPESDSGAGTGYRPQLRRGKPEESFADEDVPGYSKPGMAASKTSDSAKGTIAAADDSNVQTIPAISDASGPQPHSFKFEFYSDEEATRQKQMTALANNEVRAYVNQQTKMTTTASGAKQIHPVSKKSSALKPQDAVFDQVRLAAYDLWTTNIPVLVFSAEAQMPSASGNEAAGDSGRQYSVVLVAYPDIYGNLHKIYSSVTDKFHLDITPRLELIDAVDADGDGHGELLFREVSDGGTGWAIYGASADKLWKIYDSLNAE